MPNINVQSVLNFGSSVVLLDSNGKNTVIDYIEFSTNGYSDIQFIIEKYNEDGSTLYYNAVVNSANSTIVQTPRLQDILEYCSGMWSVLSFNKFTNQYKICNRYGMQFLHGCKITVSNISTTTNRNIGIIIRGR